MKLNRNTWILIGVVVVAAIGTGYLVNARTAQADGESNTQSQLPSDDAAANYTVPPNIGMSQDAPTYGYPTGGNVTYTASQGNSLPIGQ